MSAWGGMCPSSCGRLGILGGDGGGGSCGGGRGGFHRGLGHHQLLDDVSGVAKAVG